MLLLPCRYCCRSCWLQVSHHIHTNDAVLDEDVCSMYPLLRFDTRLQRRPWHAWQHIYVWVSYHSTTTRGAAWQQLWTSSFVPWLACCGLH